MSMNLCSEEEARERVVARFAAAQGRPPNSVKGRTS